MSEDQLHDQRDIIPINRAHPLIKIEERLQGFVKAHPQFETEIARTAYVFRETAARWRHAYLSTDDPSTLPDDRMPGSELRLGTYTSWIIGTKDTGFLISFLGAMGASEAEKAITTLENTPQPLNRPHWQNNVGDTVVTAPELGIGFLIYLRTSGEWDLYPLFSDVAYKRMQALDLPKALIDTSQLPEVLAKQSDSYEREYHAQLVRNGLIKEGQTTFTEKVQALLRRVWRNSEQPNEGLH